MLKKTTANAVRRSLCVTAAIVVCASGSLITLPRAVASEPLGATPHTESANSKTLGQLRFSDRSDYEDAARGRIAGLPQSEVNTADGRRAWNPGAFGFVESPDSPPTVNPSLWRQSQLNGITGLFKVADRIYQVRGADLANVSIIEGDTGIIVIDALMSEETAKNALKLYFEHRPQKPIVGFIYSHNHVDHFGGARGVVDRASVAGGQTQVIAPKGFMETLVAENVIAGPAMNRRIQYQFGTGVPVGPKGRVDGGLGQTISTGTVTVVPPTIEISERRQKITVDGIEIEFLLTLHAEAPSEMVMYFPQFKALNTAEIVTPLLHNLYAIRGASVRSGAEWSRYIAEMMHEFPQAELVFAQHHWPKWGREKVKSYLSQQRDLYKFIHDQSVRLMNKGYTPNEISAQLELPPTLAQSWWTRGYYGTVSHNAKAQYQLYLGWYDGNPASLNPLPPAESAAKFVAYMGGEANVIAQAKKDLEAGDYRWVAEVTKHVVFANPDNREARELQARAFEQLGYQSESAIWRNAYLQGAYELRNGVKAGSGARIVSPDLIAAMPTSLYFDYLGVNLDPSRANKEKMVLQWKFEDSGESYVVNVENATLTYLPGSSQATPDATVALDRGVLDDLMMRKTTFDEALRSARIKVTGNEGKFVAFTKLFDTATPGFNMIEP